MRKKWTTLVVDDEYLARERMKRLLSEFKNDFEIIGDAINSHDASEKIESIKPELVFLDIQMPGENIFSVLKNLTHKPFIIFCTAYDKYALQAFETFSVDYLTKPIDKEKIEGSIYKLEKISTNSNNVSYSDLENLISKIQNDDNPTSIPYKVGDKTILIKLSQVIYFHANDKYVNFYDRDGKEYLTDLSLKAIEDKLKIKFLRISKSIILNIDYVKEIHKYFRSKFSFHMEDMKKTKLISGSFYSKQIKEVFQM